MKTMLFTAITAAALVLMGGCSGPTANNAQMNQIMQESRNDAKMPAGERPIRTLNMSKGAQLAARAGVLSPSEGEAARMDQLIDQPAPIEPGAKSEMEAIEMAQRGDIARANGDETRAIEEYEASMDHRPTLDALRPLAALLASRGEDGALGQRCAQMMDVAREEERFDVLDACRKARATAHEDDALSWASVGDRAFYRAELARRGPADVAP